MDESRVGASCIRCRRFQPGFVRTRDPTDECNPGSSGGAPLRVWVKHAPHQRVLTRAHGACGEQSEGADPKVLTNDYDPYLNPGKKTPIEVAIDDPEVRAKLKALEAKHASVPKKAEPHADVGDWWALYDYGLDTIKTWKKDYTHPYPGAPPSPLRISHSPFDVVEAGLRGCFHATLTSSPTLRPQR